MPTVNRISLRAFQVGFGDCFLLTFHYSKEFGDRHMLIDFGSTGLPAGWPKDQMLKVAAEIAGICKEGKLHAVVASHRHQDHISGFSTQGKRLSSGKTTGDVIQELNPDLVIMPWTEEPDLRTDARKPRGLIGTKDFETSAPKSFVRTLIDMQSTARTVIEESARLSLSKSGNRKGFVKPIDESTSSLLGFMGENNLANLSAIKSLHTMAANGTAHYVHYDYALDISDVFPGVKATVLGPPTIDQYAAVAGQRSKDPDEFWMLHSIQKNHWALQAATSELLETLNDPDRSSDRLFPDADVFNSFEPSETRWFTRRVRALRAEQLLGLVRILDDAINNTSVILLLEVGKQKLLFPGDAQIENWEYALKYAPNKSRNLKLLKGTTVYKVGHHGSRNATPRTLWGNFGNKIPQKSGDKTLQTVISTMAGKHGKTGATAVPRATLVRALEAESKYWTTEKIRFSDGGCYVEIPVL